MRLRVISEAAWKIVAVVDDRGDCEVLDALDELASHKKTSATASGFRAWWEHIPPEGPRQLPDSVYHCVDAENEIWEFIKGRHRILCFQTAGRIVVCSHVMLKASQKTPAKEKKRAIALRTEFLESLSQGGVRYE